MKVLWITNIMFPPLCERLGLPIPVVGGWMYSSAKRLLKKEFSIRLAVATIYSGKTLQKIEVDGITYYLLPLNGKAASQYHQSLEKVWKKVADDFCPDLVHIHGTEYPHGLAFLKANSAIRVVVSIQGLISVCDRYFINGISHRDILKNITIRDVVRNNNLWQAKRNMTWHGRMERELIASVKHVIGRTSWDKSHIWAINPEARYHFCNETLRDEFYKHKWIYDTCEKYSIFLSQAGYPIKGLHQLLKALPLVLRKYPDTKVYVAGLDIRGTNSFMSHIKRGGYGSYVLRIINKLGLQDKIVFTGSLNEKQICSRYLNANLFICPSSIENSPNSLGEAQLMGVPCLASYVGGIPDMIPTESCGSLYRFEEIEMLAYKICEWFERSVTFDNTEMRCVAATRHNPEINTLRLMEIYQEIVF